MEDKNWIVTPLEHCDPADIFHLINSNREHITPGFPVTAKACNSIVSTSIFLKKYHKLYRKQKEFRYLVYLKANNTLIGYFVIKNLSKKVKRCEFAYFIDKELQGKGYTTQIVNYMCEVAFNNLNMNKIVICTASHNIASQKVALKNNFTQEGIIKQEFRNHKGQLEDIYYFGLLKDDYTN